MDNEIVVNNSRGLLLAPDESLEAYLKRCRETKKREEMPSSSVAQQLFDIDPDWVLLQYSNRGLQMWEGGCTWIDKERVVLQLRKAFESKERYCGYGKEEIVAHELLHVVRQHFEEPMFEEFLAYQTSPTWFRRFFGPVFRSSKESLFFIFLLIGTSISTLFSLFQPWVYLITLTVLGIGIGRLFKGQWIFARARKKIAKVVGKEKALAVLVRLRDREIIALSRMDPKQIVAWALSNSEKEWRWKQIMFSYFTQYE